MQRSLRLHTSTGEWIEQHEMNALWEPPSAASTECTLHAGSRKLKRPRFSASLANDVLRLNVYSHETGGNTAFDVLRGLLSEVAIERRGCTDKSRAVMSARKGLDPELRSHAADRHP